MYRHIIAALVAASSILAAVVPHALSAADSDSVIVAKIDDYLRRGWTDNDVTPSDRADDGEFARRVCLDVLGHIPSYDMLMDFLEDDAPDKRLRFVEKLLDDPDYVRNWTNLWANLLVGRGNAGGNRAALERWLRDAVYRNRPYNEFVFDLVAAEGDSAQNGAVAFLASHLNNEARPATAITARVFLGLQVQCTECHNHPFNDWKQSQFWSMNAFFRGTQRQGRQGGFMLTDNPVTDVIFYERRNGVLQAASRMFVDGTMVPVTEDDKPRRQLARLITDPEKPFLAATQVNRLWGHFFGYGFTRPVDDMGPHNPPSHPELLAYLATEFQQAGYDVKRLIRWITASEAYNLTSRFGDGNAADDPAAGNTPLFSRVYLKNFTAEQLYDSLIIATEAHKANRNAEQAEEQRRQWLQQFVRTFGTDENDEATTFNGTISQALLLMNGPLTQNAVSGAQGAFLRRVLDAPGGDIRTKKPATPLKPRRLTPRAQAIQAKARVRGIPQKIETLFLVALSRTPTDDELEAFNAVFQKGGAADPIVGLQDVFWAILNANEFVINH